MRSRQLLLSLLFVCTSTGLPQQPYPSCDTNCLTTKALEPRFFKEHNAQRQAISYGPFTVPGVDDDHGHDHGMKTFAVLIPPPCTDCYITHVQADLQYPNGTSANVNTGMWLHHVVVSNLSKNGPVCPIFGDFVFASGNERTPVNICVNGTQKAGYSIAPNSQFHLGAELMNDQTLPRDAVIVLDWEYVPSPAAAAAADFKHATPLWLDIDGACSPRGSSVPVPDNGTTKAFSLTMTPAWKATFSADTILLVGSHLHDGGDNIVVTRNGEVVCDSVAKYGETDAYVSTSVHEHGTGGTAGGHEGQVMEKRHTTKTPHVSSISSCSYPLGAHKVEVGDEWSVRANYDLGKYKAMSEGGGLAPIMGISMLYVIKN
ncbi:hypothetical protein V8F06_000597 [Rhypophila decipiens]